VSATSGDKGKAEEPEGRHPGRRRWAPRARWRAAGPSADEPWGWSLGVSDWPIGKASYDLSAKDAVNAVLGLDRYHRNAMATLSTAENDDEDSLNEGEEKSTAD